MTNGEAMKAGLSPCEWDPLTARPARLGDNYHDEVAVLIGRVDRQRIDRDRQLRVCRECAIEQDALDYARKPGTQPRLRELTPAKRRGRQA